MTRRMVEQTLRKIYFDPAHPATFGSAVQLHRSAKKRIRNLTLENVTNFLERQTVYTMHRPVKRNFKRRKTIARYKDHILQMDLVSLQAIAKENSGYNYILTVIDILSCYAFAEPLKRKTGKEVTSSFKRILRKYKRKPTKVQTDDGREFYNEEFKTFLRENNIAHYSTSSDMKCAWVERFNRMLKEKMFKYFTHHNTLRYVSILPQFIRAYNNRPHGSLDRLKPADVNHANQARVHAILYGRDVDDDNVAKNAAYQLGEHVRISELRGALKKSYTRGWTQEIFHITDILRTRPITYKMADLDGAVLKGIFYREELSRVRLE